MPAVVDHYLQTLTVACTVVQTKVQPARFTRSDWDHLHTAAVQVENADQQFHMQQARDMAGNLRTASPASKALKAECHRLAHYFAVLMRESGHHRDESLPHRISSYHVAALAALHARAALHDVWEIAKSVVDQGAKYPSIHILAKEVVDLQSFITAGTAPDTGAMKTMLYYVACRFATEAAELAKVLLAGRGIRDAKLLAIRDHDLTALRQVAPNQVWVDDLFCAGLQAMHDDRHSTTTPRPQPQCQGQCFKTNGDILFANAVIVPPNKTYHAQSCRRHPGHPQFSPAAIQYR